MANQKEMVENEKISRPSLELPVVVASDSKRAH